MKRRYNVSLKLTGLSSGVTEKNYDLKNVAFYNNGRAGPRDQYRLVATIPSLVGGTVSIRATYVFHNMTFVFYNDTSAGTNLGYLKYLDRSGNPQSITGLPENFAASMFCDFAEMNGELFFCPNYDANTSPYIIKFVGGTTLFEARKTTATTGVDQPLLAGVLVNHRGVMFCARIRDENSGLELAGNRIRWSAFAEPENFDPWGTTDNPSWLNYEDLGEPSDPIVRMVSFKNDLFIFKRQSIWLVSGFADLGYGIAPDVVREINHELGLTGPYAISWDEEKIVFISEMGIFKFDGQSFRKMDDTIWEYFRDIPRNCLWAACVNNEDDMQRYHILIPRHGQHIEDDFVLCEDGRWSRWEYGFVPVFQRTDTDDYSKYSTFIGTNDGRIFQRGESEEAVETVWASDWINLGHNGMKQVRSLELLIAATGDFPLTIEVTTEFGARIIQSTTIKEIEAQYRVLDSTAITDDVQITMDRENFFPWIVDLSLGSCRRMKVKVSGILLTIQELKIGYLKGTGI